MHCFSNSNPSTAVSCWGLLEVGRIPWRSWMNLENTRGVSDMTLPWWVVPQQREHLPSRRRGFPGPPTPMRWEEFGREATLGHQQQPPPCPCTDRLPKGVFSCVFICGHRGIPLEGPLERVSTRCPEAGTLLSVQLWDQQGSARDRGGNRSYTEHRGRLRHAEVNAKAVIKLIELWIWTINGFYSLARWFCLLLIWLINLTNSTCCRPVDIGEANV